MRGANEAETQRARQLRRDQTDAERKLWHRLKGRQLGGFKFVRQEPIGPYYADFACRTRRLVIELDGSQHSGSEYDRRRDAHLASLGHRVLRFWNHEVTANADGVLETVLAALRSSDAVSGEPITGLVSGAGAGDTGEGAPDAAPLLGRPPHPVAPQLDLSPHVGRGEQSPR